MTDSTSHSVAHSVDPREPDPDLVKWLKENCVPMVGMAFGALVFCLVAHYGSITVDWTATKDFTDAFANLTQSFALLGGGVWAYFKFAKGRTFQDRLTPSVNGRFILIDGSVFLVVTMQLKNVGLSRIALDQEATSLAIFEYVPAEGKEIRRVENSCLMDFEVFGDQDRYIEPSEMVDRQTLIKLPEVSSIGYHLELKVLSDSGYVWRATAIVNKSAFPHNEIG